MNPARCDFCLDVHPRHIYGAKTTTETIGTYLIRSEGDWLACDPCSELIDEESYDLLTIRIASKVRSTVPILPDDLLLAVGNLSITSFLDARTGTKEAHR